MKKEEQRAALKVFSVPPWLVLDRVEARVASLWPQTGGAKHQTVPLDANRKPCADANLLSLCWEGTGLASGIFFLGTHVKYAAWMCKTFLDWVIMMWNYHICTWSFSRKNVKLSLYFDNFHVGSVTWTPAFFEHITGLNVLLYLYTDLTRFGEPQKSFESCPVVSSFSVNPSWRKCIYVKIITK